MNAQIYSMSNGAKIAYQVGNCRAIKARDGSQPHVGWICQTLKGGEWVSAANRWLQIVNRTKRALASA